MTYVRLILYGLFFITILGIATYSWLYLKELHKSYEYVGVHPPRVITSLFHVSQLVGLFFLSLIVLFVAFEYS